MTWSSFHLQSFYAHLMIEDEVKSSRQGKARHHCATDQQTAAHFKQGRCDQLICDNPHTNDVSRARSCLQHRSSSRSSLMARLSVNYSCRVSLETPTTLSHSLTERSFITFHQGSYYTNTALLTPSSPSLPPRSSHRHDHHL